MLTLGVKVDMQGSENVQILRIKVGPTDPTVKVPLLFFSFLVFFFGKQLTCRTTYHFITRMPHNFYVIYLDATGAGLVPLGRNCKDEAAASISLFLLDLAVLRAHYVIGLNL